MSYLTEPLKSAVNVSGGIYPVNTDFRVWLKIAEIIDSEKKDSEKIAESLILCYKGGKIPPLLSQAVEGMRMFFSGGEEISCKSLEKEGKKIFDFTQDAGLIYASFLYDYGIDLGTASLHWHCFLMLFKNLSADSPMMRVAGVRARNPAEIKDPKEKRRLIERQKYFALAGEEIDDGFSDELDRILSI